MNNPFRLVTTPTCDEPEPPCRSEDTELFFPDPSNRRGIAAAKAVCNECPIRTRCLTDAQTRGEEYGVWGGQYFRPPRNGPRRANIVELGPDGWPINVDRSQFTALRCTNGHEYTAKSTYWLMKRGVLRRTCRTCRTAKRTLAAA